MLQAKHPVRSTYWLLIFLGLLGLTLYSLVLLIVDIYKYPVLTSNYMERSQGIPFPAVTVCNLNRVNCQNLYTTRKELAENGSMQADLDRVDKIMALTK